MTDHVVVPLNTLNELWSGVVPQWKVVEYAAPYIEHLGRYVDMGVLSRSGSGTHEDPYRYDWRVAWPEHLSGNGEPPWPLIGFRPPADVLDIDLAPDDVPADLLNRLVACDVG